MKKEIKKRLKQMEGNPRKIVKVLLEEDPRNGLDKLLGIIERKKDESDEKCKSFGDSPARYLLEEIYFGSLRQETEILGRISQEENKKYNDKARKAFEIIDEKKKAYDKKNSGIEVIQ